MLFYCAKSSFSTLKQKIIFVKLFLFWFFLFGAAIPQLSDFEVTEGLRELRFTGVF